MPTDHYVQVINEEEPTKAVRFGFAKEEEATAFKRDLLAMAQTHPISIVIGQYVAGEKCPANHGRHAIVAADLAASREREARAYQHIDWTLQMHMPNLPENKDRHYIETRLRLALEALNPTAYAQLVKDEAALSQSSAPASEPDVPESGV